MLSGIQGLDWVKNKLQVEREATLAVAFWGSGATTALGLDVAEPHERRISIICNLAMGGTNPHEIEKLRKLSGVEVRQCDTLHAKIYKFSDAAMVGSSNVSANGLSFEGPLVKSWHEANLVTTDEKTLVGITNWIDALPTQEIDDGDLELAKVAWGMRQKNRPAGPVERSIIELLEQGPAAFAGLDVYLILTAEESSEEADLAVASAQQEIPTIAAWEGWDGLPNPGTFVSFIELGGTEEYDGCYQRLPTVADRPKGKGNLSLQWCFPGPRPQGLKSPEQEKAVWKRIFEVVLKKHGSPTIPDNAICIDFKELSELWLEAQQ